MTQIDLEGSNSVDVGPSAESYTDNDDLFHGTDQPHIAATHTYPDGSLNVLYDLADIDSSGLLTYNGTWSKGLYD